MGCGVLVCGETIRSCSAFAFPWYVKINSPKIIAKIRGTTWQRLHAKLVIVTILTLEVIDSHERAFAKPLF